MTHPATPNHYPNLPVCQRFTQWLVDQFNDAEHRWRSERGPIAVIRRRIKKQTVKAKQVIP